MANINVAKYGKTGSNTVAQTAKQLTTTSFKCKYGVTITCPTGNAGTVYFGYISTVTANAAADTSGHPIAAGGSYLVAIDDPSKIYIISDSGTNTVFFDAV